MEDLRRAINADNIRAALCIKHVDDCRMTSRIVEANQDIGESFLLCWRRNGPE